MTRAGQPASTTGALGGSHAPASPLLRPPPSACRLSIDQIEEAKV